jgi:hypothetical protein
VLSLYRSGALPEVTRRVGKPAEEEAEEEKHYKHTLIMNSRFSRHV